MYRPLPQVSAGFCAVRLHVIQQNMGRRMDILLIGLVFHYGILPATGMCNIVKKRAAKCVLIVK